MPVRSINLRLVVPRSLAEAPLRRALWTTHAEVNAAARYYEEHLLRLRGEAYVASPSEKSQEPRTVSRETAQAITLALGREAQETNGHTKPSDDTEVIAALQALYQLIIPAETGTASAQNANGLLSPLTDRKSRGFGNAAEKLDRPRPNWLSLADDDPDLLDLANAWFESEASEVWRRDTGSPARWILAARSRSPDWPSLFRAKLLEMERGVAEGKEAVVARCRTLGLLPLFPPYFSPRMAAPGSTVTPWDRLAFRLSVAHLLSWEAWCRRAAEQHATRRGRLEVYRSGAVTPEVSALLEKVRSYERDRAAELSRLGLGSADYTLRPRQLRGWADLRDDWLKAGVRSPEELRAIAARHQTRKRGRFGDPQVFLWLAEPRQHGLWSGSTDVLTIAATLNTMQALLDRSRETATMTLPDARLHPRSVQWSAPGDSNLRPYRITASSDGSMRAMLKLLRARTEDGLLEDTDTTFRLAPSGQLRSPELFERGKKAGITFKNDAGEHFVGVVGSGDLLFNRRHLHRTDLRGLEQGAIGAIWLKLALDVDPALPSGWDESHARFRFHFSTSLGNASKTEDRVREGARVLSVDLGLRTLAACSVFELQPSCAESKFGLPVRLRDRTLWAVHQRSFHLTLPGEDPSRVGAQWRLDRDEEMRRVRRALRRYRRIMQLGDLRSEERQAALEEIQGAPDDDDAWPFEAMLRATLTEQAGAPQPVWAEAVKAALAHFRTGMGPIIHAWRQRGREPEPFVRAGKSMWAIQHLTDLRRTLQSWSLLGRATGEVRRLDRAARGTFASGLLDHIDHIKEDRLKTGADLIVRAALGFARDTAGRWQQRYAPCDVVLFEDLSRYRMRTDRPRRENSQLMRWAHRGVPAEVQMQGALYGIEIADTSAAFSSRYHARTLTPGIRCQPLSAADLNDDWLRRELDQMDISLDDYRPGDLVPRQGGQIFACLRADGRLTQVDADINAAQNLQRRYWTRHADAFRLPCVPGTLKGAHAWLPRTASKRLLGALGGTGFLEPTGHDSGSCRWVPSKQRMLRQLVETASDDQAEDPDAEEIAGLAEEAEMQAGKVEVFFRDPSGVIWPADLWYPARTFWGAVTSRTIAALKRAVHLPAAAL